MNTLWLRKNWHRIVTLVSLLFVFSLPGFLNAAEIPSVEDIIEGGAQIPTIEALTDGKVKEGDVIDKNNVELIKEYICDGVYEMVMQGLNMKMGSQLPADKIVPKFFREITEKNMGKAIIDQNGAVYYESLGNLWPGGVPFVRPETGLQVMANPKYGCVYDGFRMYPTILTYTNPEGRTYKSSYMEQRYYYCTTRKKEEPLGAIPGYENILYKRISVFISPLNMKGLGQYTVRYYDDAKDYDTGFAYLPAYKRTIRVSAVTWQDNIGGSDYTYGDGGGLQEPYSYWDFKLLGKKFILLPEPDSPFHFINEETGMIDERVKFTVGQKFVVFGWAVWPVYVVEGMPKIKHLYGKKMFYVHAWPYWPATWQVGLTEAYDRQMKLWKVLWNRRDLAVFDGETYTTNTGGPAYDLQSKHMTNFWYIEKPFKANPEDMTLNTLLAIGR